MHGRDADAVPAETEPHSDIHGFTFSKAEWHMFEFEDKKHSSKKHDAKRKEQEVAVEDISCESKLNSHIPPMLDSTSALSVFPHYADEIITKNNQEKDGVVPKRVSEEPEQETLQRTNPDQQKFLKQISTDDERNIERVVEPKSKKAKYKYTENGRVTWIDEDRINFMNGPGKEILNSGKDHGFSSFGSMFMMAQSSIESGWGKGNFMDKTHNLFSMMGGSDPTYGNRHGSLKIYDSYKNSIDDYVRQLNRKWPGTVASDGALFKRDHFTPDEANKSFNQEKYYPTEKERNSGKGAYNANPESNYGSEVMQRMRFITGPYLTLQEKQLASEKDPVKRKELETKVHELQATYKQIKSSLSPQVTPVATPHVVMPRTDSGQKH